MSDNKIINIDKFRKKPVSSVDDIKNHITIICGDIVFDIMKKLKKEGYNTNDPDLLYDLEIVTRMLLGAVFRQTDIKSSNVDMLDRLRKEDEEE